MDYTADVMDETHVFTSSSDFMRLKLQSPMPSPFEDNNDQDKEQGTRSSQSNELSPTKPGRAETPTSVTNLENSVISLGQELRDEELRKVLSKFDIFKLVLSKVGGKDRLAKVSQYVLNLIKLYLINTRRYLIDEKFANLSLDPRQHWQTPFKYLKLLLFLNSTMFEKKITEVTKNISAFRYALRFGGTPNRVRLFLQKLDLFVKTPTPKKFVEIYMNEDFLGDFIDLYYGIFDELELLYKVNVLTNESFKKIVVRQGALAWYADILLGLKKNWCKLQENRERQIQINIQHQVKQKASLLSKRLMENIGNSPFRQQIMKEFNTKTSLGGLGGDSLLVEMKELKHEETIILLDLVRLLFDFACDSIDVFDIKLHPSIYLFSGAISGICGLSKVWVMSKKEMTSD